MKTSILKLTACMVASFATLALAQSSDPGTPAKPQQQNSPSKPEAKAPPAAEAKEAEKNPKENSQKPADQGVTVHGHWTIEVRNPDGTLAQRREFENSLTPGTGPSGLLPLVEGASAAGDMAIMVQGGLDVCAAAGTGDSCYIAASTSLGIGGQLCAAAPSFCSTGLMEVLSATGTGSVTLTGNMPVLQAGAVSSVATVLLTCSGGGVDTTVTPAACFTLQPSAAAGLGITPATFNLTSTTLTPVSVTAGQSVLLSVVLTFS